MKQLLAKFNVKFLIGAGIGLLIVIILLTAAVLISKGPTRPEVTLNQTDNFSLPTTDNIPLVLTNSLPETGISPEVTDIVVITIKSTPVITAKPKPTNTKAPETINPPTTQPTIIPTIWVSPTTDYSIPRQVGSNCPVSTQRCVPCTSGTSCRFELGGYPNHGFLGFACQDNNPGNIRPSDYRNTIIVNNGGTASCGKRTDLKGQGDYMVFATYDIGWNALKAYIRGINNGQHSAYTGCGNCTLSFFFSKWALDTGPYASAVGLELGVDPTTTTIQSLIDGGRLDDFAIAIKHHEGWFTY